MKGARPLNEIADSIRSIMVLKADHLGDLMLAAPAAFSLKKVFERAKIVLAGTRQGARLYRTLGLIDDEIFIEGPSVKRRALHSIIGDIMKIRRMRFDLVVNMRHDFRDILFTSALKGRYLCTYDHKGLGRLATHVAPPPDDNRYERENHLRLVEILGVKSAPFVVPEDPNAAESVRQRFGGERYVVLHPVARTPAKQWPLERFRELALALEEKELRVACVGGPEDEELCGQAIAGIDGARNLAGELSFTELFALLRKAEGFAGVDSFVMHAAAAVGLPGVAIFSGTNVQSRWAPPEMSVVSHATDCAPCRLENCNVAGHPCMNEIDVKFVVEAMEGILERGGAK